MTYRNRVTRCRHGMAHGIVKCEACEQSAKPFREALKGIKPRFVRDGIRDSAHGHVPVGYRGRS